MSSKLVTALEPGTIVYFVSEIFTFEIKQSFYSFFSIFTPFPLLNKQRASQADSPLLFLI